MAVCLIDMHYIPSWGCWVKSSRVTVFAADHVDPKEQMQHVCKDAFVSPIHSRPSLLELEIVGCVVMTDLS